MTNTPEQTWTIGQLAETARVTVRTLHHYDRIGLLRPAWRTDTGYRVYSAAELERLHLIRLYREASVPLDTIRSILNDPDFDRLAALKQHLERLDEELERNRKLHASLSSLIQQETDMSTETPTTDLFQGFDPKAYEDEAAERWGNTRAYKVSQRRTKNRTPEEWARCQAASKAIEARLADAMARGVPADGPEAMDLAEQHRQHITDWFYPCGYDIHVGLGELYVADPRFTEHYDKRAPGLAQYVSDAIFANAAAKA